MPIRQVHVRTPARLHFGMFGFGPFVERQFGGVGVMLAEPCVQLRLVEADQFSAEGADAERVAEFARRWSGGRALPRCRIEVRNVLPAHVGLGSGTQLGLCVAAGLDAFVGTPRRSACELAPLVGRGRRSAVGLYGFDRGGLIVEAGKLPDESIAPLVARVEVPEAWRVGLVIPQASAGLSGERETRAFAQLPAVPVEAASALRREVEVEMLPALRDADFVRFAESVYRFGFRAGECFAPVQGGPYAGSVVTELIQRLRSAGFAGTGQSSWGPAVFTWLPSADRESALRAAVGQQMATVVITRVANRGATIEAPGG